MDTLQWNVAESLDDGGSEDVDKAFSPLYGRLGTVFLIECSPKMLTPNQGNSGSYLSLTLNALKELILKQIKARSKDSVGVVYFGTVKKDKLTNPDHITTFLEISEPSADNILKIEKEIDLTPNQFEDEYGFSSDYSLSDGLWHCSSLFRSFQLKFRSQKIILATCNDNPSSESFTKQHQIRKRASDLVPDRINFQLLPFGEAFNASVFYKEVLQIFNHDAQIPPNVTTLDEILPHVLVYDSKVRSFGNLKFCLKKDTSLAVSVFKFFRKATLPTSTALDRVQNEAVKRVTNYKDVETDGLMLPSELSKAVSFAGEHIDFTEAEHKQSPNALGGRELRLLGFKPADSIKFRHFCQSSLFIVPAEKFIKGSESLFITLRDCLVERNKVALCYLTVRRNGSPKLVYLIPQKEEIKDGVQIMPDGFHVVFLPFAEQFRTELPFNDVPVADRELRSITEAIVKKLTFRYSPSAFENPKLATFWAGLEALALNRDEPRAIDDATNPPAEDIANRIVKLAHEFNQLIGLKQITSKSEGKRPGPSNYGNSNKKKK